MIKKSLIQSEFHVLARLTEMMNAKKALMSIHSFFLNYLHNYIRTSCSFTYLLTDLYNYLLT